MQYFPERKAENKILKFRIEFSILKSKTSKTVKKKQKSLEVVSKILLVLFNNFWFLKLILDWKLRFTMWSTAY